MVVMVPFEMKRLANSLAGLKDAAIDTIKRRSRLEIVMTLPAPDIGILHTERVVRA